MIIPSLSPHVAARRGINPRDIFESRKFTISNDVGLGVQAPSESNTLDTMFWAVGDVVVGQGNQRIADKAMIEAGKNLRPDSDAALASYASEISNFRTQESTGINNVDVLGSVFTDASDCYVWAWSAFPRFFDIVKWTGSGSGGAILSHAIGDKPGMILVKRTDAAGDWAVYHSEVGATDYLTLNSDAAAVDDATYWSDAEPTESNFSVGLALNASGADYVAFVFGNDPQGDGYIRSGSYTGDGVGSGPLAHTGWIPEWVMIKRTDAAGDWMIYSNPLSSTGFFTEAVRPNEATRDTGESLFISDVGFQKGSSGDGDLNISGATYAWVAIRAANDFGG